MPITYQVKKMGRAKQDNKTKEMLQRQMHLFNFIKAKKGSVCHHSNEKIAPQLLYDKSIRNLQRDLDILEQKFLIRRSYKWISKGKSIRTIKVVNQYKELLSQCNYKYLEAVAIANPQAFKLKWREGYNYFEGDVSMFLNRVDGHNGCTIGHNWAGTGMWLSNKPIKTVKSIPNQIVMRYDTESVGSDTNDIILPW